MTNELVVLGAGGELPQYIDALDLRADRGGGNYRIVAVLDDAPELVGRLVHGVLVGGALLRALEWPDAQLLWGLGSPRRQTARLEIYHRLRLPLERYFTLVHADALVSPRADLCPGATILAGTKVSAGVRLEPHSSLGFNCVVEHGSIVGAGTLVACGCLLAGNVTIGAGSYLGQGCNIKDGCKVGRLATIGMGAVVLRDVEDGETVVGNPARTLHRRPLPPDLSVWLGALDER